MLAQQGAQVVRNFKHFLRACRGCSPGASSIRRTDTVSVLQPLDFLLRERRQSRQMTIGAP
ncbi:hypothetical protein N1E45_18090, partial [Pseudomonas aeruginosa]|nr:hypothetical protein [Pseudomonas aeruginosa]MCS8961961.1 hypothetical protein [Pseudomonas aeruginosa]MCS8968014.1 hypothetical protein [Pseudomonas aeruginosa]MCS9288039.1 hypothetical protein [Pseudomonas aeruginosa]MCS9535404.1 hypothetical protein [Pseudomonas aeruginosa]